MLNIFNNKTHMELDKNSLLAKYVKWFTLKNLPNNFCAFFWLSLFSIIISPVMFLFWLAEFFAEKIGMDVYDWEQRILVSSGALTVAVILSVIVFSCINYPVYVFSAIAAIALIIFFVYHWHNYTYNKKQKRIHDMYNSTEYQKPIRKNILVEFIKAKKQKYCPIIEWSDNVSKKI